MATMGVHINRGYGGSSGGGSKLAQTLVDALFGNADDARQDALARSKLATDEYVRDNYQATSDWTRTRDAADAAKLAAIEHSQPGILAILNRANEGLGGVGGTGGTEPAPVDLQGLLPDEGPIPGYRPDDIIGDPAEVDLQSLFPDEAPIPGMRPHMPSTVPIQPQQVMPPLPSGIGREPDYGFSTYPMQPESDLPDVAPIPYPRPVTGDPRMDVAELGLRPPAELAGPMGQQPISQDAAGMALIKQLTGLPDALQPVAVGELPPEAPLGWEGTNTQIPGRTTYPDTPVPIVPPAGPAGTGEPIFQPPAAALPELAPVDMPPEPAPGPPNAEWSSPSMVPPYDPVDQPEKPGDIQQTPDGNVSIVLPSGGKMPLTQEQLQGIAELISWQSDAAGQAGKFSGLIDMTANGLSEENATLYSGGTVPAMSSVLGVDETNAVEAAKPGNLKDNIVSEGGMITELYKGDDGITRARAVPVEGATNGGYMQGDGLQQNWQQIINDTENLIAEGKPITREQAGWYDRAVAAEYVGKWEARAGPDGSTIEVFIDPAKPLILRSPQSVYQMAGVNAPARPEETLPSSPQPGQPQGQPGQPLGQPQQLDINGDPVVSPQQSGGASAPPPDAVNPELAVPAVIPEGFDAEYANDGAGPGMGRIRYRELHPGKGPKMTEMQTKSTMFYIVGNKADGELDKYGPQTMPHWARTMSTQPGSQDLRAKMLANLAATPESQIYWVNGMNFANAIMRSESGAATRPEELDIIFARFIPHWNDTAESLALKTQYREAVLEGLRLGAIGDKPTADELVAYATQAVPTAAPASGAQEDIKTLSTEEIQRRLASPTGQ